MRAERAKSERTAAATAHGVRTAGNIAYIVASVGGNVVKYFWEGFEQTPENYSGRNGYRGAWQFGVVYSIVTLLAALLIVPLFLAASMFAPAVLLPIFLGEYMVPLLNVRRRELAHSLDRARRVWRLQLILGGLLLALIVGIGIATMLVTAGPLSQLVTTLLLAAALGTPWFRQCGSYREANTSAAALNQPPGLQPGFEQDGFELPVLQNEQGEWYVGTPEQSQTPAEVRPQSVGAPEPQREQGVRHEIGKLKGELSRRRQRKQVEQEQRQREQEQERQRREKQENVAERLSAVLSAAEPSVLYKQSLPISIEQARRYVHVLGLDVQILALEDDQERGPLIARKLVEHFHGLDVASQVEYEYQQANSDA